MAARTEVEGKDRGALARLEGRRRSLVLPISFVVFLLVAALLIAVVAYLLNYQPLINGSMTGLTPGSGRRVDTYGDPETLVLLNHREGETFDAIFTLHNDGPLPITIEGVGNNRSLGSFVQVDALAHPGERYVGDVAVDVEKWPRLSSVSLGAGDEHRVAVRYRFSACNLGTLDSVSVNSVPIRFSVLGIRRNTEFNLPYTLALTPDSPGNCP